MATLRNARKAKAKAARLLDGDPRVQGIGITKHAGEFAIKVNLLEASDKNDLPTHVDGVRVDVEVVGPIRRR